jgi:hypothetical protein
VGSREEKQGKNNVHLAGLVDVEGGGTTARVGSLVILCYWERRMSVGARQGRRKEEGNHRGETHAEPGAKRVSLLVARRGDLVSGPALSTELKTSVLVRESLSGVEAAERRDTQLLKVGRKEGA